MPSFSIGLKQLFNERSRTSLLWPWLVLLVLFTLLASPWAQAGVSQSVRLPNQEYTENREDIKVKVLGGHVRINRSWVAGKWYLNPAWANLRFVPDPLGGVLTIDRAGSMYKCSGIVKLAT